MAFFFTIPDGTILAANPAACQMFGMTEEELIRAGRKGAVDTSDPRLKSVFEERAKTGRFKGELAQSQAERWYNLPRREYRVRCSKIRMVLQNVL